MIWSAGRWRAGMAPRSASGTPISLSCVPQQRGFGKRLADPEDLRRGLPVGRARRQDYHVAAPGSPRGADPVPKPAEARAPRDEPGWLGDRPASDLERSADRARILQPHLVACALARDVGLQARPTARA